MLCNSKRLPAGTGQTRRTLLTTFGLFLIRTHGTCTVMCWPLLQAWSSALDIIIGPFGFDQQFASRMGFWSVGAGAFAGVVLSVLADRFQRRMKLLISCMFCLATAGFFVFCLVCVGVLPHSHFLILASVVIGVAAMSATNPCGQCPPTTYIHSSSNAALPS